MISTPSLLVSDDRPGARIYNTLVDFIKRQYWFRGYTEVISPNVYNVKLWETSGHWQHYAENMFQFDVEGQVANEAHGRGGVLFMTSAGACVQCVARLVRWRETGEYVCGWVWSETGEGAQHVEGGSRGEPTQGLHHQTHTDADTFFARLRCAALHHRPAQIFALKPMNCPGHCLMYASEQRSYRELPMRYADFGVLHRNELSGALTGLTRVSAAIASSSSSSFLFFPLPSLSSCPHLFDFKPHRRLRLRARCDASSRTTPTSSAGRTRSATRCWPHSNS